MSVSNGFVECEHYRKISVTLIYNERLLMVKIGELLLFQREGVEYSNAVTVETASIGLGY